MDGGFIEIKGARVNNLKNVNIDIPRDRFVVVTGLSGSGKTSLAFDTLYAEGQRRYLESLSAYTRQFLGKMKKPDCDFISGIPPAIAIEQKVSSRNPRSTVGTSTEIYDYLRMLFARVGKTISPVSGKEVRRYTPDDIMQAVSAYGDGTKLLVLAPLNIDPSNPDDKLRNLLQQGFSRIYAEGEIVRIDEAIGRQWKNAPYLLIDRAVFRSGDADTQSRIADSVETALYEGGGDCRIVFFVGDGKEEADFCTRFEADGIKFEEPSDQLFNFNSPLGACPKCDGFGKVLGIDERLVIPNTSLSIYDGAVVCWRGEKMGEWRNQFIQAVSTMNFPVFSPYYSLSQHEKDILWNGAPGVPCIADFFRMLEEGQYKIQYRVMLARYRGKTTCPLCRGSRLRKEALYVQVGGKNIAELGAMSVAELSAFFATLVLNAHDRLVGARLLDEIRKRLRFLSDVGLGYLTLNRASNSLSGGESQRINLATSLGSSLVGSLYILDEPSIGLHSKDTDKLVGVLRQLTDIGNTVVVVEHDEDIIRKADYIIDVGVGAGSAGGNIVYKGDLSDIHKGTESYTLKYLLGEERIPVPETRRAWNKYIQIEGARENNLKGITVKFPLNVLTVVTGVSGSGKSTLVNDIFYRALKAEIAECDDRPGEYVSMDGDINALKHVEFVDQNPIGKSSRSNPVTYVKAFDEIRKLFADQQLAKQMGYSASYFSFNMPGGRCDECKGEGTVTVEMQFMADLVVECESCHGKRFKPDVLEITFQGKNICDILDMTVDDAIVFFSEQKQNKIVKRLKPLQDVGLGYVKLGQSSSTLSGGESQRVKLAYFLGMEVTEPTMFIFDEPTTGLHFHDIRKLISIFNILIKKGHSVLVIEHNLDVIKCADYVIDLGPDGGDGGGCLVACGTPEEVAHCEKSYTAHYLKEKLNEKE